MPDFLKGNVPFQKVTLAWQGSVVLFLGILCHKILSYLSVMAWIRCWYEKKKKILPVCVVEVWATFLMTLLIGSLVFHQYISAFLAYFLALYILYAILGSFTRDTIVSMQRHRDEKGGYIGIQHRTRWLLLSLQSIASIILSFAVLFRYRGMDFKPAIKDSFTAVYQSLLTFTTLGYGDIRPCTLIGKILVSAELIFFLLFLTIKLPVAVKVLRVKIDREGPNK